MNYLQFLPTNSIYLLLINFQIIEQVDKRMRIVIAFI